MDHLHLHAIPTILLCHTTLFVYSFSHLHKLIFSWLFLLPSSCLCLKTLITLVLLSKKNVYLQLLLLGKAFDPLSSWSLAHKCHDPDQRSMAVQHGCDLLYTLPKWWKDHHTRAYLLRTWTWTSRRQKRNRLNKKIPSVILSWILSVRLWQSNSDRGMLCSVIFLKLNTLRSTRPQENVLVFSSKLMKLYCTKHCYLNLLC